MKTPRLVQRFANYGSLSNLVVLDGLGAVVTTRGALGAGFGARPAVAAVPRPRGFRASRLRQTVRSRQKQTAVQWACERERERKVVLGQVSGPLSSCRD